ncbi:MAG: phospholipid carrier-dependent glycosyltransferase, partial [Candidatus Moranbacteria bacterium]|nr:phospholipid carrier-dependent glycosyltransferase [Candidatus Moranbacteria bacterium]
MLQQFKEGLKKFHIQYQHHYIWLILLLATANRFTGLMKRDFWYDEAFTGVAVKEKFWDMITMTINDVHPPFYYIVLKAFAFFFNYSVFGIRLFSAIFGVAAIWALYLLAKEMFNEKVALYAALVATISPFAIQYSQEARMYMMLVFFILIGAYFFVKSLQLKRKKYFFLWGLFTGLSMLTHYMGIIFSAVYILVFVAWRIFEIDWSGVDGVFEKAKFSLKKFLPTKEILLGYGVAFLVFLPWLKMFVHHISMKGSNLSWVKKASLGDIVVNIQMFLFGTPLGEMSSGMPQPNELFGIAHISIRMLIAMLFGIGIVYLMRKEKKEKVVSLLLFSTGFMFIIYVLSATLSDQQYFVARYLLPAAYFIFIFIGLWLSRLRSFGEPLSGGGCSSGLMSFLKIGDRAAGAIKSGGTTRR